jgi:hypothetical protein
MMVESLDANQKQKCGEKKKSEKLLRGFMGHIAIVPVPFLQLFFCSVNEKHPRLTTLQWFFTTNITI